MKGSAKKTALTTAIALLTTASVMTGSLFDTPAALLDGGDAVGIVYQADADAGEADGDADTQEGEEKNRRGGSLRASLRARLLRLPLAVRLLVLAPLWAVGSAILAAAGALAPLLSPLFARAALFALLLALLVGCFTAAAKTVFPDLPLRRLLSRRSLLALALGAAGLAAADAVLGASWEEYETWRGAALSVAFFLALAGVSAPALLREQKRRLDEMHKKTAKKSDELVFTDAGGTFTVKIPHVNG